MCPSCKAEALAAIRARRSLDDMDGWLPAAGTGYLRSGQEMAAVRSPVPVSRGAYLRGVKQRQFLLLRQNPGSMPPGPLRQG
jgi:error-prone DNA polymerase